MMLTISNLVLLLLLLIFLNKYVVQGAAVKTLQSLLRLDFHPPRKNLSEFLRGVAHNIRCGQPYV